MEKTEEKETPLGVLLIVTEWILVGAFCLWLNAIGNANGGFSLIIAFPFLLLGIFFIFTGWGLLSFKSWAYHSSLVTGILGSVLALGYIPTLFIQSINKIVYGNPFQEVMLNISLLTLFVSFPLIVWQLYKKRTLFIEIKTLSIPTYQSTIPKTKCLNCGEMIPYDSLICPYCAKKFRRSEDLM
jgi:hypothetical protein